MKRKEGVATNLLFESHSKAMYNICLRMMGNKPDAEDVLQNAFVKAFTNLRKLNDPERFSGWLKRIVINQCIQELRAKVYYEDVEDLNNNENLIHEEENVSKYSMEQINRSIQLLPDGCRVVFNLYLIEDYKHKEIAGILNISESTSKSQYQRARKLLQEQLRGLAASS